METIRLEVYAKDCTSSDNRKFRGYSVKRNGIWYRLIPCKECPTLPKDKVKFYIIVEVKEDKNGKKVCPSLSASENKEGYTHYYIRNFVGIEDFEFDEGVEVEGF